MAGAGRIIVSIAVAAGLCFVLGLVKGAEWVSEIQRLYEPGFDDPECWGCYRLLAAEIILLWFSCVLIALVPAAIIGHSPSPRRRLGLVGLIGAMAAAALVGFVLSTGIGGRLGFPEGDIPYGIITALVSVSIGAGFGYEVGSVIRRHGEEPRLPTSERSILTILGVMVLGVMVLVIMLLMLLMLLDAIFFG
jgi:hypothetical protein